MFIAGTRKVRAVSGDGDVTADVLVLCRLFDVSNVALRVSAQTPWNFGRGSATGTTVLGAFIDSVEVTPQFPRDVVVAVSRSDTSKKPVAITLFDASGKRPVVLPGFGL